MLKVITKEIPIDEGLKTRISLFVIFVILHLRLSMVLFVKLRKQLMSIGSKRIISKLKYYN